MCCRVPTNFCNTDLEKILKDKGIKTVIAVGTSSNGAVLFTASGAAFRGMNVDRSGRWHVRGRSGRRICDGLDFHDRAVGFGEDHADPKRHDQVLIVSHRSSPLSPPGG